MRSGVAGASNTMVGAQASARTSAGRLEGLGAGPRWAVAGTDTDAVSRPAANSLWYRRRVDVMWSPRGYPAGDGAHSRKPPLIDVASGLPARCCSGLP